MTKEELGNLVGEFTWSFNNEFFIETHQGNFVWSAPDYQGTGEIRSFTGNYDDWCKQIRIPYGRDKGTHVIKNYCGDFVFVK